MLETKAIRKVVGDLRLDIAPAVQISLISRLVFNSLIFFISFRRYQRFNIVQISLVSLLRETEPLNYLTSFPYNKERKTKASYYLLIIKIVYQLKKRLTRGRYYTSKAEKAVEIYKILILNKLREEVNNRTRTLS